MVFVFALMKVNNFAENYRTTSYSRRYHYPNRCSGDESDYSAVLHADDLAKFIVDKLGRCMPNSASVSIPESTHETPADNPEAYKEAALGFLAEQFAATR